MYIIGDDIMNVAYSMLNIFALIILTILMVIFFSKKDYIVLKIIHTDGY